MLDVIENLLRWAVDWLMLKKFRGVQDAEQKREPEEKLPVAKALEVKNHHQEDQGDLKIGKWGKEEDFMSN